MAANIQSLSITETIRLLNGTRLGEVTTLKKLREYRLQNGEYFVEGNKFNFLRLFAWLFNQRLRNKNVEYITISVLSDLIGESARVIVGQLRKFKIKITDRQEITMRGALEFLHLRYERRFNKNVKQMARLQRIRANLAELTLRVRTGALVDREIVEQSVGTAGRLLRELVLDCIATLPEMVTGVEIREAAQIVERELSNILSSFQKELSQVMNNAKKDKIAKK